MAKKENTDRLVLKIPAKGDPGYLRRQRDSAAIAQEMADGRFNPEAWSKYVDYLLRFVSEPADREKARELLWDISEDEFDAMLSQIRGDDAKPPLAKSGDSANG
jgi:hypothetical protein